MQQDRIPKFLTQPSHICLVLERGYADSLDADLKELAEWRFQDSKVLIVIIPPDGSLNCIGCEPHEVVKSISDSLKLFKIKQSKWEVLCSPRIAVIAQGLLSGAYDYARQAINRGMDCELLQ